MVIKFLARTSELCLAFSIFSFRKSFRQSILTSAHHLYHPFNPLVLSCQFQPIEYLLTIFTKPENRLIYLLQLGRFRAAKTNELEVVRTTVLLSDWQFRPREYLLTHGDNCQVSLKPWGPFKPLLSVWIKRSWANGSNSPGTYFHFRLEVHYSPENNTVGFGSVYTPRPWHTITRLQLVRTHFTNTSDWWSQSK